MYISVTHTSLKKQMHTYKQLAVLVLQLGQDFRVTASKIRRDAWLKKKEHTDELINAGVREV